MKEENTFYVYEIPLGKIFTLEGLYGNKKYNVIKTRSILNKIKEKDIEKIVKKDKDLLILGKKSNYYIKNYKRVINSYRLRKLKKKINKFLSNDYVVIMLKNGKKLRIHKKKVATSFALLTFLGIGVSIIKKSNTDISKEEKDIKASVSFENDDSSLNEEEKSVICDAKEEKSEDTYEDSNDNCYYIDYEDNSLSEKALNVRLETEDIMEKYEAMYGIDKDLMIAIATNENSCHTPEITGFGGVGQMQIEYGVWSGETISAYNFLTNSFDEIYISDELITSLDGNIKIAFAIFQNYFFEVKNIPLAIQMYNMGPGNIEDVLDFCSESTGISKEELLNGNMAWLDYTYVSGDRDGGGVSDYLKRVLSFAGSDVDFTCLDRDGNYITCKISNKQNSKSSSKNF